MNTNAKYLNFFFQLCKAVFLVFLMKKFVKVNLSFFAMGLLLNIRLLNKLQSIISLLLISFLLMNTNSSAQSIANYTVTRTTSITFNSISSTGTPFSAWRNSSTNLTDDNRSFAVNIGFEFWYMGARYTQVSASTNGFVDLSSSTADGNSVNPYRENPLYLSQNGGTLLAMAPFYEDLWTGSGGTTTLSNSIKYQLSGSAPYRVFTIEYIGMDNFTAPNDANLNFQVKFYESTGVIEIVYDTMTAGTSAHSYGCGINGATMSGTPAVTELLEQQMANSTTFNNTPKYNFTTVPTSNSKITFTPPTPANPSALVFSAITKTSMTLNWTDLSVNELKYVIYNSTDGINFSFAMLVNANTFTANVTGLIAGTNYFWNVYAVTEGKLSAPLSGIQATLAGGTYTSAVASGKWNTAGTWTGPGGIPGLGDDVIILDGHVITIDVNAQCKNLTIGQSVSGSLLIGSNGTARTLTILGDILVRNGAAFKANKASSATHVLNFSGNLINNGTVDFNPLATSLCNVTFLKNGNQNISGAGTTTRFNKMTLNMGSSNSNFLEITSANFTASTAFLTLTNGTFKLSTGANLTPFTASASIPLNAGLLINHESATVNTTGGTITLYGLLSINLGILNIGNASNNCLTSNGGTYIQSGGIVTIASRFDRTAANDLTYFTMSGGILIINSIGSTTAALAPFHMTEDGSSFIMLDGFIIIRRAGAGNLGYLNTLTSGTVTGGTLQIGDASTPSAQVIQITTVIPVFNLTINSANATGKLFTNSITVLNDVMISTGVLDANSLNIILEGNWVSTSFQGDPFVQGNGTVTFSGSNSQTISTSTAQESFYNLTISNSGEGVLLINSTDIDISNVFTLINGIIITGNDLVVLTNFSATSFVYTNGFINGNFRRYIASNVNTYLFPVGCGNSYLNKHTILLLNNLMVGVSYIDAKVTNFFQTAPNNDASLLTSQNSNQVTSSAGQSNGETIIWTLAPNSQPIGGSYGVQLSTENTNLSSADDNSFCPLKRNNFLTFLSFLSYDATTYLPAVNSAGRVYNSGNGFAQRIGYTSFSQFIIGKFSNTLPIKLVTFDAKKNGSKVDLTWTTSSEINNEYFSIERSSDGIQYETILTVLGAGNSTVKIDYKAEDNTPLQGTSYYRLKQTDFDGKSETFKTVAVAIETINFSKVALQISPSLFNESFTAQFELSQTEYVKIQIINMIGSVIYQDNLQAEKGNNLLHFSDQVDFKPGTYLVRIVNENEELAIEKIVCSR